MRRVLTAIAAAGLAIAVAIPPAQAAARAASPGVVTTTPNPWSSGSNVSAVYDPAIGTVVVLAGYATYEWSGARWAMAIPASAGPELASPIQLAYEPGVGLLAIGSVLGGSATEEAVLGPQNTWVTLPGVQDVPHTGYSPNQAVWVPALGQVVAPNSAATLASSSALVGQSPTAPATWSTLHIPLPTVGGQPSWPQDGYIALPTGQLGVIPLSDPTEIDTWTGSAWTSLPVIAPAGTLLTGAMTVPGVGLVASYTTETATSSTTGLGTVDTRTGALTPLPGTAPLVPSGSATALVADPATGQILSVSYGSSTTVWQLAAATAPPAAVAGLTVAAGTTSVELAWTPGGGPAPTGYRITWTQGSATGTATITGLRHTITALSPGRAVGVTVTAVDAVGAGPSSSATATPTASPPPAVTGLAVRQSTGGRGTSTLAWSADASATTVRVETSPVPTGPWSVVTTLPGTATTYTVSGLAIGSDTYARIVPLNGGGSGPPGQIAILRPSSAPTGYPTAATATMTRLRSPAGLGGTSPRWISRETSR